MVTVKKGRQKKHLEIFNHVGFLVPNRLNVAGQIIMIPKAELREFWWIPLLNHNLR